MQHAGDLEDEDGIAVGDVAAAPVADVGGDVAHAHIGDRQIVLGRAAFWVQPLKHSPDAGIGEVRVVRGMRPVHGGDLRHHLGTYIVVVVGGDPHGAGALDQPGRVPDEGEAHLGRLERGGSVVRGLDQARRLRYREAAIGKLCRGPSPGTAGLRCPRARQSTGRRRVIWHSSTIANGANDRSPMPARATQARASRQIEEHGKMAELLQPRQESWQPASPEERGRLRKTCAVPGVA